MLHLRYTSVRLRLYHLGNIGFNGDEGAIQTYVIKVPRTAPSFWGSFLGSCSGCRLGLLRRPAFAAAKRDPAGRSAQSAPQRGAGAAFIIWSRLCRSIFDQPSTVARARRAANRASGASCLAGLSPPSWAGAGGRSALMCARCFAALRTWRRRHDINPTLRLKYKLFAPRLRRSQNANKALVHLDQILLPSSYLPR